MTAESEAELPFTILAVCTGNICRSPAAERLLAGALGPSVSVVSAGTRAMVGEPISAPMNTLIEAEQAVASDFVARQLTPTIARPVDLVLAMTRPHRSAVVEMAPALVRRAFTLREFARLLESVDPLALPSGTPAQRLRAAVPLAAAKRGQLRAAAVDDDVVDPYRRGEAAYATSFQQLLPAVRTITRIVLTSTPS